VNPYSSIQIIRFLTPLPLLAAPWLNPFTSGPNASVMPFLFCWACTAAVMVWWAVIDQTAQQRIRTVALAWLLAACLSAVLGLLQYFDISRGWAPWVNQPGLGQAFGNLRQRNQFATLCSIGLAALGWWWAQQPRDQLQPQRRVRLGRDLGACAMATLMVAAIAASGSRTGLLQLAVLAVLGWCWARKAQNPPLLTRRSGLLVLLLLAYLMAAVVLPRMAGLDQGPLDRWSESSAQCNSRLNLWRNVLYLIAQKPLWGWGWGDLGYAHFITLYDAPWAGLRFCELLDNAHNLPLHLAVELGVPVALLLCIAVLVWIWRRRPWQEQHTDRKLAWAVLAVIGVHSLLEYPLWYAQFQVAALLCLWVLYAFPSTTISSHGGAPDAKPWGPPALAAGVFIGLACAIAGWSYWRVSQPYLPPEERAPQFKDQSWAQIRQVWMFSDQVDFAQLAVTPVVPANAAYMQTLATDLLHFSPEPMVVQKLLQSAQMQGKDADVAFYGLRFKAAYPADYANWAKTSP